MDKSSGFPQLLKCAILFVESAYSITAGYSHWHTGVKGYFMDSDAQALLDFWYSKRVSKMWFTATVQLDNEIRQRFEALWCKAAARGLEHWTETAQGSLALVILLDQMPLNMFRNEARSFQTEAMAVQVAKRAIERQQHKQIAKEWLAFLFMPLMHSEELADQELSVRLFEQFGLQSNLRFARHHRDIIRKYGRFPHRNRLLKRESTPEEQAYLASKQAFKG